MHYTMGRVTIRGQTVQQPMCVWMEIFNDGWWRINGQQGKYVATERILLMNFMGMGEDVIVHHGPTCDHNLDMGIYLFHAEDMNDQFEFSNPNLGANRNQEYWKKIEKFQGMLDMMKGRRR